MSEKKLREAVESLRNLTPRLNAVTDLANETVRNVENFLNDQLSLGIPACVLVSAEDDDDDDDDPAGTYLEYRRVGPRFRIAVVVTDSLGRDATIKAWSDCSRTEKLSTFKKLPELLTKLATQVAEDILNAEQAAKEVDSLITVLRTPI
jgi:hypothetical protein